MRLPPRLMPWYHPVILIHFKEKSMRKNDRKIANTSLSLPLSYKQLVQIIQKFSISSTFSTSMPGFHKTIQFLYLRKLSLLSLQKKVSNRR